MKNIVITGTSGFIGSNLVKYYKDNYNVISVDKNKSLNTDNNIDCAKYEDLKKLTDWSKVDFVIDCAARTDLNGNNLRDYDVNFLIIKNFIKLNRKFDFKIIAFSSMLVNKLPINNEKIDRYNPNTIYGESKMIYETILKASDSNYIIVRPTSVWGPNFNEPYKFFFEYVLNGKFFVCDKNITKTYCYIS